MPQPDPIAFMSYVRFDDQHEDGRLSEFRERLSAEVRMQTGEAFPIFQDRNDIQWGENWKQRIDDSLDGSTFLIPIITPSFFRSEACREEVDRFRGRETELNKYDLILPVYYVNCPAVNDPTNPTIASLAELIFSHQYADWRELRFEPLTSPEIGRMLAKMAVQIREALGRVRVSEKTDHSGGRRAPEGGIVEPNLSQEEVLQAAEESAEVARGPALKTEPPTHVVDPMGRANFTTISSAISAANPGDRIMVRPGLYQEELVIEKPLEILGDGNRDDIVVQSSKGNALLFQTTMGRVSNLTLRQTGGAQKFCVTIDQGRLLLEDCDINSRGLACVAIRGGADPRLKRNRIHDGKQSGVLFYDNGGGTLEDNDIYGNALAGVEISKSTSPTLRRNRIHENKGSGVSVYDNGDGALEDNDIVSNAKAGVHIRNTRNLTVRGNRINRNAYQAVWVHDGGGGTIEDNDLRVNERGAWSISEDCENLVKRARNQE